MRRNKSLDELLSKQLRIPEVGKSYILESMEGEEGKSLVDALFEVIGIIGITEYAEMTGMQRSNLSRLLSSGEIPKIETLNTLLSPYNLKTKLDVEEVA